MLTDTPLLQQMGLLSPQVVIFEHDVQAQVPYYRLVEAGFPAKINNSAQGSSALMQPHLAPGRAAGTIKAGKKNPHQKGCFSPVRLVLGACEGGG